MGLVQAETNLRYQGQPWALLQSLGYVFASMVKQYHLGQTAADANWLIGEGLFDKGQALASLEQPGTAYDNPLLGRDSQVGHMSQFLETEVDNGGVHINCGIPNRAFVIVAKLIEGYSWERAGRVWYEAVCRERLGPDTNFHEFARKTLAVSKVRFGGERRVTDAV